MSFLKKYFGPSTLVTAAFIGPGTLTVCTLSGANFGYSLLWVLLFATIATIILQEMTARLGLITQNGLGEAIRSQIENPIAKTIAIMLVFAAIIVGNAAYEAGNISGAVLGISGIFEFDFSWALVIGLSAFGVLFIGKVKIIERILIGLVILMSLVFVITAILVNPDFSAIVNGLFIPSFTEKNQLAILGLIGTTIVPYNLFLHASSVSQKWKSASDLKDLQKENGVAIGLGGLISMAIVITSAATIFGKGVSGLNEMAIQLEPLLGSWARYFLGLGLFAAGISSAITAPLAAAYAAKGIFGWNSNLKSLKFRIIWMLILAIGVLFSMIGYKPIEVIQIAQVANGILLPVIVFFLIYLCNKKSLLNQYVNKPWQNGLAILVIAISLIVSFRSLNSVFSFL
ncbi:NRAMP (natural resistance-associated macrophage protein) metal ion transporters [Ekhidna lutea]|uniref:NRAMP (Natural resistance-associated macrophage protein) metal ion transporters n=1 Tax=Ekhidna lutea TaxID=447679 RepID=A0A239EY27_EKHLU|nr:Nramp family divalent metal transporter [Ekhidna lutea]SNS49497.1 NRAMP (natural resistance-associated macrophage protein) metal ion transporters [Ekhidna lutea]